MSNERFTDELLSAIIDGEADTELVASVSQSLEASARLNHMREAVQLVAEAPAEATPQRRSASIAAAMAAASPAPEVTSLAAARHDRDVAEKKKRSLSSGWVVAAAAAVAFLVAIPIAIGFGGSTASDVADSANDSTSLATDAADDDAGDAADAAGDAFFGDVAGDDDAMDDAAEAESVVDEAVEEEAMEEDAAAAEPATTTARSSANERAVVLDELLNGRNLTSANNVDVLNNLIGLGSIEPLYSADDLLFANVPAECLQADQVNNSPTPYGVAVLTPFGGQDRLILVEFAEDGTTRLLDAEDCAVLR